MRVIAGEFRGRKLLPPDREVTRPITDRVKQSLFDILTPRLQGAYVWDLFAGTGSQGLESLSRGAEQSVFFETDRSALERLRRNIQALGLRRDRAVVQSTDVFRWFQAADKSLLEREPPIPSPGIPGEGQGKGLGLPKEATVHNRNAPHPIPLPEYRQREKIGAPPRADIIFLDPPYRYLVDQPEDLRRLARQFAGQHLHPHGIVVFRHDAHDSLELPGLTRYDERIYGGMTLEFLRIAEV